jgi:flagellar motor protein MotB
VNKRRRHKHSQVNHERWLVSYADFITLLFAFFVVLYAASQVDKHKASALAAAIEQAFQSMGGFPGRPRSSRGEGPKDDPVEIPGLLQVLCNWIVMQNSTKYLVQCSLPRHSPS